MLLQEISIALFVEDALSYFRDEQIMHIIEELCIQFLRPYGPISE